MAIIISASLVAWQPLGGWLKNKFSDRGVQITEQAKKIILPAKAETFQITQAEGRMPKIVQATIDPPDVHVGDRQKLTVIVQDDADITSVEARIETDHDTLTLPLNLIGEAARQEILPPRLAVDKNNHLFAVDAKTIEKNLADDSGGVAKAAELPKLKYEATWTVRDTHDTTYHTTFAVRDARNRENSVTIAWSDACGIPMGGNWSISSNCFIGTLDGVDNGNVTLATYTLSVSGTTFAWNPGQTITITTGAISLGASAQLQQTYLWEIDTDSDNSPDSFAQYAQDSAPTNGRRRYLLANNIDCNSTDPNYYVMSSLYPDGDSDGVYASYTSGVCVGTLIPPGWSDVMGSDCDDTSALVWHIQGTACGFCVGASGYINCGDGSGTAGLFWDTAAGGSVPDTVDHGSGGGICSAQC